MDAKPEIMSPSALAESRARWRIWSGPEVEGRIAGVPTLFFGEVHPDDVPAALMGRFTHFFVNPEQTDRHGWDLVDRCMDLGHVTVSTTPDRLDAIPERVRRGCHVMCFIPRSHLGVGMAGLVARLKPDDTIRVDLGLYHNLSCPAACFVEAGPGDYLEDVRLDA